MNSSKKALIAAFKEASFDPRQPGTLSAIVSCNDPDYLAKRAAEFLREADRYDGSIKWAKVRDAVAVLGYAMTLPPKAKDGP